MDAALQALVDKWNRWDRDEKTRAEIAEMVAAEKYDELRARLGKPMVFGTAGLRGKMRAGFDSMNNVTVQQASQGLAQTVAAHHGKGFVAVIGYDGRYHSAEFAAITAKVFAHAGAKVYLYSEVVPTPWVPYGMGVVGAHVGVMVTASHNPKFDNGYKVYWDNGCQIIPPIDGEIAAAIAACTEPWDLPAELPASIIDPTKEVTEKYLQTSFDLLSHHSQDSNKTHPVDIVYTAMHGVGAKFVALAFEKFGLQPYIGVEEQLWPDPEFPTAPFPNPEEGAVTLKLAMEKADAVGSRYIIATDPDADRLAVGEKLPSGKWYLYSGNEIGALIGCWSWEKFHAAHPEIPPSDCLLVATAVSSQFLRDVAAKEGLIYEETLTGFKWLGNCALRHMKAGRHFVCGFEEAIGYMIGEMSLDKDGVRTAAMFGELICNLKARGHDSLYAYLQSMYAKYAYHKALSNYYFCYDPQVMYSIFGRIRKDGKYPEEFCGLKVIGVRDLTVGYDNTKPDNKPVLPVSASSEMITFTLEGNHIVTIRGSGTEPKLKYYIDVCGDYAEREKIDRLYDDLVKFIGEEILQAENNGLKAPL